MSQEAVERFLGRLLTDDAFRQRAASSLAQVCREEGYQLSDEEQCVFKWEVFVWMGMIASQVDSRIKRFTVS